MECRQLKSVGRRGPGVRGAGGWATFVLPLMDAWVLSVLSNLFNSTLAGQRRNSSASLAHRVRVVRGDQTKQVPKALSPLI
jgi:hypothetical protein